MCEPVRYENNGELTSTPIKEVVASTLANLTWGKVISYCHSAVYGMISLSCRAIVL